MAGVVAVVACHTFASSSQLIPRILPHQWWWYGWSCPLYVAGLVAFERFGDAVICELKQVLQWAVVGVGDEYYHIHRPVVHWDLLFVLLELRFPPPGFWNYTLIFISSRNFVKHHRRFSRRRWHNSSPNKNSLKLILSSSASFQEMNHSCGTKTRWDMSNLLSPILCC